MRTFTRSILIALLLIIAAWLKAAKETKGGSNMMVAIRFPIAEGAGGEGDFRLLISW